MNGDETLIQDVPAVTPVPRTKRRGCLARGCLLLLGLVLLVVVVIGGLLLRVPQQLGFWPSGARLLDGTPDRAGAAAITKAIAASGVDTTGLSLYVLPISGQTGTLAYAVLDASAGFRFPTGAAASPIVDMFRQLATGPSVDTANVKQVAIEYRDASGRRLGVLTASTDVIRELIGGQIDTAAFSARLHGDIDPAAALQAGTAP